MKCHKDSDSFITRVKCKKFNTIRDIIDIRESKCKSSDHKHFLHIICKNCDDKELAFDFFYGDVHKHDIRYITLIKLTDETMDSVVMPLAKL